MPNLNFWFDKMSANSSIILCVPLIATNEELITRLYFGRKRNKRFPNTSKCNDISMIRFDSFAEIELNVNECCF